MGVALLCLQSSKHGCHGANTLFSPCSGCTELGLAPFSSGPLQAGWGKKVFEFCSQEEFWARCTVLAASTSPPSEGNHGFLCLEQEHHCPSISFLSWGGISAPNSTTRTLLGQKQTLVPPRTALPKGLCAMMETSPDRELRTKPTLGPPQHPIARHYTALRLLISW